MQIIIANYNCKLYIFRFKIKLLILNTGKINTFFILKNKTRTFFKFYKTDNIKSIIEIFNNNKFIDEQKKFVSNNKLINIIKNILDSGNFKQEYTNLIKK